MAYLARKIVTGERTAEEFFKIWPDLSPEEERDVLDLWYDMQSFENDTVHGPESNGEFYRLRILEVADELEERFKVKWATPNEEG